MFDYKGKVVLVSGASSGLGAQMAKGYAKQGATLIITARRVEKLEQVAEEIRATGVECYPIKCDVTDVESIKTMVEEVKSKTGIVDVLVNCAGSAKNAGVLTMTDEEWDFTIKTDMTSLFYVTREIGKLMKENNYGRIINIASMYGMVGNMAMDTVAYHTSKGGVINFTRAVAAELAKFNITCNAICPGYFDTELTHETLITDEFTAYMKATVPLGRYGKEGELNAAAIFLGSEEASYVTGAILPVDGGYTAV